MQKERANKVVKKYVESEVSKDWTYRESAKQLYELYDLFRRYLFAAKEDQLPLPQAVIAIEEMRVDTLATYRLVPNSVGLPWEISLNAKHLNRPLWEHAESLLHETVHLYQEDGVNHGRKRFEGEFLESCKRGYHNAQFVELCEEVGLHPLLGIGAHWMPGDGQFERLMLALGYEKPEHAKGTFVKPDSTKGKGKAEWYWWAGDRGTAKGSSTLLKYQADVCLRPKPCVFRAGRDDLEIACRVLNCGGVFRPVF